MATVGAQRFSDASDMTAGTYQKQGSGAPAVSVVRPG